MTAPGAYDSAGRANLFSYANGTRSDDAGIGRDNLGRAATLTWETAANTLITSSGVTNPGGTA